MPTRRTTEPVTSFGSDAADPSEFYSDPVVGLTNARPVLVDHARLTADFPWLRPGYPFDLPAAIRRRTEHRIEEWLTRSTCVVSAAQVRHDGPHETIPNDGVERPSHRAARQGRCCEVEASWPSGEQTATTPRHCVRFAVKGSGVPAGSTPGPQEHETGLASLHELLQEHLFERLVTACLAIQGWDSVGTVPYYAIFDAGFDFSRPGGSRTRAGLGLRPAVLRPAPSDLPSLGSREQRLVFETELRLRRFGVTSATTVFHVQPQGSNARVTVRSDGADRKLLLDAGVVPAEFAATLFGVPEIGRCLEADRINIQYASSSRGSIGPLSLVDFGQYRIRERFDRDLSSTTSDGPLGFGGRISAASVAFAQPGRLRPNPARWVKRAVHSSAIDESLFDKDGNVWQGTHDAAVIATEVLRGQKTAGEAATELDRAPMIVPIGSREGGRRNGRTGRAHP